MEFRVFLTPKANSFLNKCDSTLKERIYSKLRQLKYPYDIDRIKIRGRDNSYRTRVGNYRVLFSIYNEKKIVVVTIIDKRSRVYERK